VNYQRLVMAVPYAPPGICMVLCIYRVSFYFPWGFLDQVRRGLVVVKILVHYVHLARRTGLHGCVLASASIQYQ
jgi:hypothetical protein